MKVCHFRDDFSNAFVTKRQTDKLRREAFGVRRIPALCESSAPREAKAPEYGALQTLRAIWLRLGRAGDRRSATGLIRRSVRQIEWGLLGAPRNNAPLCRCRRRF